MKEKWEIKKVKDICTSTSSNLAQNKLSENVGNYPLYGANGFIKYIDFYQQDKEYIAIVKDGAGVGRVMIMPSFSSVLGTLQYIIPNKETNIRYLYYALTGLRLSRFAMGAAIPHIYFKDYGKIPIPIPPLSIQEAIVKELDILHCLKELQAQQLAQYDHLAQSTFYNMFGDPIENEKGWEVREVGDIFSVFSGGTPSTKNKDFWENGTISWIGSNMCQNTIIYENDGKFITKLGYEKSSAKLFDKDFVLVALVGATIGKVALLKFQTTTNQNIAGIDVPGNQHFSSAFVFYAMMNLYELFMNIGNGKFKMANLQFIRSLPLITPPLSLQTDFANRIEKIEAQKALVKQAIAETQLLIDYTMDKYFG